MQQTQIEAFPLTEEVKRDISNLVYHIGEAYANTYLPFVLFNRNETIYHLKETKRILDKLVKMI